MASTFAAQLRSIAANSTNELDLRARREAHGESLIFERNLAVKQDWDTIYQICVEGFQELCLLDSRLHEFDKNLFSPQAKDQDRDQLSRSQNDALGVVIERCLALIGGKLLLRPGVKAVEWLVRRFRVHVHNTGALLATFLPYHESPIFRNVLNIVPAGKITSDWKFLGPYHKIAANVPRHAIVYSATNNDGFFSTFNNHVLRISQEGAAHTLLLRFWGSMVVEAITARLNHAKSGRKEVQKQRQEDVLLKVLPLLTEGFDVSDCVELTITCFTIAIVLASNADLDDTVLDSLMRAIAPFVNTSEIDATSALTCLAIIVAHKSDLKVSKEVLQATMTVKDLSVRILSIKGQVSVSELLEALITSSLVGLKKRNFETRLLFLNSLLEIAPQILEAASLSKCLALLIHKVQSSGSSDAFNIALRTRIIGTLQTVNEATAFSSAFPRAASVLGLSLQDVEAIIGGTIEASAQSRLPESDAMDVEDVGIHTTAQPQPKVIESILTDLAHKSTELSFITNQGPFFEQLAQAFTLCHKSHADLQRFEDLPLWQSDKEQPSLLYESFILRFACGAFHAPERASALASLSRRVHLYPQETYQLLLPYLTVLLADAAHSVRRSASSIIIALQQSPTQDLQDNNSQTKGTDVIHDPFTVSEVRRVPINNVLKVIKQAYIPALEECILDFAHIRKVLQRALDSTAPSISNGVNINLELKKSLRQSLFSLLTDYAVACPLMRIKTTIIELLVDVYKVGTQTTTKALSPILQDWAALSDTETSTIAVSEGLSVQQIDAVLVQLINAQDKEGVERVLTMLGEDQLKPRPALVATFFDRIGAIWRDMRHEARISASIRLFDMAFSKDGPLARGGRHVLQISPLSTDVLATILDHACSGLTQMQSEEPPKKRRRTSHGRESMPKELFVEVDTAVSRLTFALEIVDNSKPESHPELLSNLFDLLITLRRLKDKSTSESPYLLTLCLNSILAIVEKARTLRKPTIDMSSIRADLIIDCARSSDSPQVQTTALLLAASLASLAPDRILHNIMPIFTFMGHDILSKDDERSIYVTNQAIDQIIPPLVSSLHKQDAKNLINSTSSLLSSFVTAYNHVPQHRRISFYQRLLNRLGIDNFSFAVIALLATSNQAFSNLSAFFSGIMGDVPAYSQLLTYRKTVDLSQDIFADKPHDAESLLNIVTKSKVEKQHHASVLLETAATLLKSNSLKIQVRRMHRADQITANQFREEYKACLPQILALLRDQKAKHSELVPATRKCLSALLELPSVADFLNTMPSLLQDMEQLGDEDLQTLALRVLASQLQHNAPKDTKTNIEAVALLPTLESIISTTGNEAYRHAAIACLDRIVEVYGRKNPEYILSASTALVEGNHGLESTDPRTQVMSLLCLASMMEVLKEAAVPLIPSAVSKVLVVLKNNVREEGRNAELHNAAFALLSAFISHIPFMISDDAVVEILKISYQSALLEPDASCQESRKETLNLLAHKLDIETIAASLIHALKDIISDSTINAEAVSEYLDVLSQAIEQSPKSAVVKSAGSISSFILQILDLRRLNQSIKSLSEDDEAQLSERDLSTIELTLHTLSISFVYKLNDTTFRPIFETWIEWASKGTDLPEPQEYTSSSAAKIARMTSLFNLLAHFFDTLKSIVTSYASYILESANEVLQDLLISAPSSSDKKNKDTSIATETLTLYTSTLTFLTAALTHDADGFFTIPSHFTPLHSNLLSQLRLSSTKSKPLRTLLTDKLPTTLIALATATIDTPAHHHSINHLLCQLRHDESAAVRLAGIRMQIALTEDEEVGDEWVNNVVVGTTTTVEGGVGGSGETMVYVNESLEDDDEEVEREVRRWVRMVREKVGEDVFEV